MKNKKQKFKPITIKNLEISCPNCKKVYTYRSLNIYGPNIRINCTNCSTKLNVVTADLVSAIESAERTCTEILEKPQPYVKVKKQKILKGTY